MSISQSYVSRLIPKIVKEIGIQLQKNGVIEPTGRTNKKTAKTNKSTSQLSITTPIMDIKSKKRRGKKLQTIYEYLKEYPREEIDTVLSKLTEEETSLVKLRYGDDLDNPVASSTWGKEETNEFYGILIPKMKKLLSNLDGKRKTSTKET